MTPLHAAPENFFDERTLGAVVNQNNARWVALRRHGGHTWLLDSCQEPAVLDDEEFLAFTNNYRNAFCIQAL